MKKIIAILLVCVMAMGLIPMMVSADETWSWTLNDGVLTVTGTGSVGESTSSPENYPWHDKRDEVTEVVIGDGITYVGKNSFTRMSNLTKITVGKDCTKLGMDTFSYNQKITSIEFKGTITEMAQGAFYGTKGEGTVAIKLYGQTEEQFMAVAAVAPYNCSKSNPPSTTCLDGATYTVVDAPADSAVTLTLTAMYGKVENYSGKTLFIIGGISKDVLGELKSGNYTVTKAVITDETENKTYTISNYDFGGSTLEADTGNGLFRLAACDYGVEPKGTNAYTIAIEISDAEGKVLYTGSSEKGAFVCNPGNEGSVDWRDNGPIKPEQVKHWYDEKEPVTPPTPATVKDVVVYYPKDSVAMTATATGTKLTGVAATKDGNKLVVDDNTYVVLTMTTEADGTFTLQNAAGEYLTSGATGNGISFAAEKTDLAVWVMDGIFIKNTTAAYNNNPQYLEYYSGFTTYGKSATANEEAYTFELIDAADVSVKGVTPPQPPVTGDATVIIAVVAIVALFGTAVVVTKKVTER